MKRVLSLLLVAAMLLAIPVLPVGTEAAAQEPNVTDPTSQCPCCGVAMDQLTWTPWNNQGATPPAGHYYLTEDYNQTSSKYVMAWDHVVLDLRGHKWSSYTATTLPSFGGYRMMTIQGYFYLMDTVGNGVVETQIKPNYGGAFLMDVNEHEEPQFHFLSGTIRPRSGEVNYRPGGMIYVNESSIFKMTGGVIENYRSEYKAGDNYSATVASTSLNGGVFLGSADSQILIHGGTIRNCSVSYSGGAISSAGTVELKNCTFMNCRAGALGGAVYTTGKQLVMENCDIVNCSAYEGGAVYATAGVKATDGTIMNNTTTTSNGGGFFLKGSTSAITGTRFIGNTANKWGGNIAMNGGTLTATNVSLEHGVANCTDNLYNGGGNFFAMSSAVANFSGGTIRDGYSANHGGNMYVSGSTVNLTGTAVTGGVAYKTGDNIRTYNGTMTLDGANISGDMVFEKATLTLKNATKIGLNNTGLMLTGDAKVNASALTAGAEIYVQAADARNVAEAGAKIEYFKGAYRTVLAGGDGTSAITSTVAESGTQGGYCPHCNALATWTAYTGQNETGHFYLTAAKTAAFTVAKGTDMVIDLNGKVLTNSTARYINLGEFTIMDSGAGTWTSATQWTGGMVKGSGLANNNGGVIHNNGTFNLYGGTLVYVKNEARNAERGGVVYLYSGTMNMYGGVLDGSAYDNTTATGWITSATAPEGVGAAFYQNAAIGSTFTMSAGRMIGGTAYAGGTAGFGVKANATITGGSFYGGTATTGNGGNLYFPGADAAEGTISISNVSITDGTAKAAGGNVAFGRYYTTVFDNCFIADGVADSASGYGGNLAMTTAGLATVNNSIILSGRAFAGGNVAVNGTAANINLDTCYVSDGVTTGGAGSNGGNLIVSVGSSIIKGGELIYGVAGNNNGGVGGNICCSASGKVTVQKNSAGAATKILSGYAKFGGNITAMGNVTLTDAVIGSGNSISIGKDIQISGTSAALAVGSGVTGKVSVWPKEGASIAYGAAIFGGTSTGLSSELNMFVESLETQPIITAKDGKLTVSGVQMVDANGNTQWCADYAAAEAAAQAGGYVKLYADTALALTKDTYVDLNGNTATVSGTGKLLGMDTTGDSYAVPTGKVTFTGTSPVTDKSIVDAPNGNRYVALVENGAVSFHRLGADLTSVTINIDKNAVYFKGKFGADSKLKEQIDTYGIAVSLSGMPDNRLSDTKKTSYKASEMENDAVSRGVYITNILREDLTNKQNNNRGRDKIYATAYVTLTDGTTTYISDDTATSTDDISWSLYDVFNRLDTLIDEDPTNFRKYTNTMRDYYAKWKDKGIADWIREDTNFVKPAKDDTIDILMIGSSFCTYYVQEMWQIAEAAGVKLRVCNVYYSGCPLSKYYTDWLNGTAAYQFYETTGPERKSFAGSKSLEWCLAQGDWDVISMQEYSGNVRRSADAQTHLVKNDLYTDTLFPYITSSFPDAKFYFHQSWSFQIGYVRDQPHVLDAAQQAKDAYAQQEFAMGLLAKYGDPATSGITGSEYQCMDGRVPTGEAWQLVREGFGGYTPYDNLCKRTGTTNNAGDYYHDGDLGGGQYLNGLVWFFQIMKDQGKDFTVADITWQPDNTTYGAALDTNLNFNQLKDCAYEAVYGDGWTYNAANYQ